MYQSGPPDRSKDRSGTVLFLAATIFLGAAILLLLQNANLRVKAQENTLAIENLSSQLDSLMTENSDLRSQSEHLQDTIENYQERVRSYQTEIYELRRQANITGDNTTLLEWDTISVIVPAVMAKTYGIWGTQVEYIGIATTLTLEVVPGRGRVLVTTDPTMGDVFQDTAVTAKETAEKISDTNLFNYDLIFSIRAPDIIPSVDGPSAGAAMTLMVLSLLEKEQIRPSVSMTGTIFPDGKIGAIGSAVEKAEAVEKAGAIIFCIPKENEYTTVVSQKEITIGPWIIKRPFYEKVETKAMIEERTDLTVYLVEDIMDLVEIATYKES